MSRRSGTRTSQPARAKTPAKKREQASAARNGDERKQVGTRAFTRRARAGRGRTVQRTPARGRGLAAYAARLPSVSLGAVLGRLPRAAWICALVACLNAVCWSIVTPPFEVTDEPDHFAYVKQLAETGSLPTSSNEQVSTEIIATLVELRYYTVRQQPQNHTIASHAEQAELERELGLLAHEKGNATVGAALSQPPLYYALEAIPYTLAKSGTVLDRLQLMRLFSALFAGFTAMFAFLFVREALPGAPWAWTVGGLSVALAPLLGFMSGAVNPDAMLFAVSAGVFYCLARAFRRGLDARTAIAIGALTAIGVVTKLNFVGLVPGVLLGLLVLSTRALRASGCSALRLPALAIGIAFSPVLLYMAINVLSHHRPLGALEVFTYTIPGASSKGSLLHQLEYMGHLLDYVWQLYLPRVPGAPNYFPGLSTARQLWFDRYVGLYGWLDTTFPSWVENVAIVPAGAIALLCGRALLHSRNVLRSRWVELAVYATMAAGLMVVVGAASYRMFPGIDAEYAQPRYLLPLLVLLGASLALAARGAGRRWGPVAGVAIVTLFLAHDVLSQLLETGRFYA